MITTLQKQLEAKAACDKENTTAVELLEWINKELINMDYYDHKSVERTCRAIFNKVEPFLTDHDKEKQ